MQIVNLADGLAVRTSANGVCRRRQSAWATYVVIDGSIVMVRYDLVRTLVITAGVRRCCTCAIRTMVKNRGMTSILAGRFFDPLNKRQSMERLEKIWRRYAVRYNFKNRGFVNQI